MCVFWLFLKKIHMVNHIENFGFLVVFEEKQ